MTALWGAEAASDGKTYKMRKGFSCHAPRAQLALVRFCEDVVKAEELKVVASYCWPLEFRKFLVAQSRPFPSLDLQTDLNLFLRQNPRLRGYVGFDAEGGGPIWTSVSFRVGFDTHSSGRTTKPFMDAWESFAEAHSDEETPLGSVLPMSDVFERAEAELQIINSALSSWLVSVACALAAVVTFTRSFYLSTLATFAIFSTAACSLYTITIVFEWDFGLMEAVSLIIFCGFSVDYPLHVVQSHISEHAAKGTGARQALREVGCAVASGCVTTCGAAVFLLLCEIRLFTRFGQVLICNMIFSLLFAIVWIPAALEVYDPLQRGSQSNAPSASGCVRAGGGIGGDECGGGGSGGGGASWLSRIQEAVGISVGGNRVEQEPPEGFVMLAAGAITPRPGG